MTNLNIKQGFGATLEAIHSRSFHPVRTSPRRPGLGVWARTAALGALALGSFAASARAEVPLWNRYRHLLGIGHPTWQLDGQTPARMEASNLNGHAGAEVAVRFTPSNSLVVFANVGMELCPHRLALSGVTDFALVPGGILFSNSQGLSYAIWNSVTNTFSVSPVANSGAFANATSLSTASASGFNYVAGISANGTGVAWSKIVANVILSSYVVTAPPAMNAVRLLRWNPANPVEIDLAIRTNTTITVRNSSNVVLPNASYDSYGAAQLFCVQPGTTYDRLHFTVPVWSAQYLGTIDPVLGPLTAIDASGYQVGAMAFGDYDGTGAGDAIASLVSGGAAYILHGNPWNQMSAFTIEQPMAAEYGAQDSNAVCALADFEGDGDLDIIGLSDSLVLEVPANRRIQEDNYGFQVIMEAGDRSLVNHKASFTMRSIQVHTPAGVQASMTHLSIEIFLRDTLTGTVSATPWATRLVPLPQMPVFDEDPVYDTLPDQNFQGLLGSHPDNCTFFFRLQGVYSANGTTITTRLGPAQTSSFSFDTSVMTSLAAAASASFVEYPIGVDVDVPRTGDTNRESNISPFPRRP